MAFQQVPVRSVDITSGFWSQMQRCSKEKTIPAIIKAQKSLQHWYCLTWKEGHEIQPHVSSSRTQKEPQPLELTFFMSAVLG
jgi:hypothetical protein